MILKVWDYNNVLKDAANFKENCHGLIMLFFYETFRPSHQEGYAAGSLCSEFEPY